MGQNQRAADDLIGLLGVNPQPHVDFHRLVEFRWWKALQKRHGIGDGHGGFRFGLLREHSPHAFRDGHGWDPVEFWRKV